MRSGVYFGYVKMSVSWSLSSTFEIRGGKRSNSFPIVDIQIRFGDKLQFAIEV